MAVTIYDVAREAGVSKSTVSLVINNSPSVKLATQYKVREAIQKLGYVPNYSARTLTTKRTHTLGMIFLTSYPSKEPYSFDAVPETLLYDTSIGIQKGLHHTDYALLTERFSVQQTELLPELISAERVDGVFIIGGLFTAEFIDHLKSIKMPSVLVGRFHDGIDSVSPNMQEIGYLAGKEFVQKGHKKILFINGPNGSANSQQKLEGLMSAFGGQNVSVTTKYSGYSALDGYKTIQEAWSAGERPDAIFGGSDGITSGIVRFLYENGIRVPEQVSLIGYERSVVSEHAAVPYTVIDPHKEKIGIEACRALLNRIQRPRSEIVALKISPSIIHYGSVRDYNE